MSVEKNFKVLNQDDLLKILPFGKTKLNQLLKANELPVVKVGRDYITTESKIEQWINENIGEEIFYD